MRVKYIILLSFFVLSFFDNSLFGQVIQPEHIDPSPYHNGIMKATLGSINEDGDSVWYYKHDTLSSSGGTTYTGGFGINIAGTVISANQSAINYWTRVHPTKHYINGNIGINTSNPLYEFVVQDSTGATDGNYIAWIGSTGAKGIEVVRRDGSSLLPTTTLYGHTRLINGLIDGANSFGTSGYYLKSNGSGAAPTWTSFLSGGFMFNWNLAAEGTGGVEFITDNEQVNFKNSTGITVTRSTHDITHTLSARLQALHNLAGNGYVVQTGSNTFANRTITGSTGIGVANGDGVSGNTVLTVTDQSPTNEFQTLTVGGTSNKDIGITPSGNTLTAVLVPSGGATGQVVKKTGAANGAYAWADDLTGAAPASAYIIRHNGVGGGTQTFSTISTTAANWVDALFVAGTSTADFVPSSSSVTIVNAGTYRINYSINLRDDATAGTALVSGIRLNGATVSLSGSNSYESTAFVTNLNVTHIGSAILTTDSANQVVTVSCRLLGGSGSHSMYLYGQSMTIEKL